MTSPTFYDQVGGHETFARLVHRFYEGVAADAALRDQRGHPRLRMRHAPFAVTPDQRDRWLAHMKVAVDELELEPGLHDQLWDYLERAAYAMVNTFA